MKELKRKSFGEAISDAYADYIFGEGLHSKYYQGGGEFHPTDTPNRNPKQVPNGTWHRLIYKHINKHHYN